MRSREAGRRVAGGPVLSALVLALTASWALSGNQGPARETAARWAQCSTCARRAPRARAAASVHPMRPAACRPRP